MGNFIYLNLFLRNKIKMILEEVIPHPHRSEIYINEVITPHDQITERDKNMVNNILIKEIARKGVVLHN